MSPVIVVAIVLQFGGLVFVHVVHVLNGFVLVHVGYGFVVFYLFYLVFLAYQLAYLLNYLVSIQRKFLSSLASS
jgi:hypothetical protein